MAGVTEGVTRVRKFDGNATCWQVLEGVDVHGKIIVITGTTSGIGVATTRSLALAGAHVVCLNRNQTASEQQIEDIRKEKPDVEMSFVKCDLASIASVRLAAEEVLKRFQKIDVLILNAGIYQPSEPATSDGLEATFGVNHVGHFHLTTLLLPLLVASAPMRIVVVSSLLHTRASISKSNTLDEKLKMLMPEAGNTAPGLLLGNKLYAKSKMCNVLFTMKLHRDLHEKGVDVMVLHPGVIATKIGANMGVAGKIMLFIMKPFQKTVDQGAATTVYCATNPEITGVSGKFWDSCWDDEKNLAKEIVHDEQLQDELWRATERIIEKIENTRA